MNRRIAPFADAPTDDLWLAHSVPAPPGCADLALGLALRRRDRQPAPGAAGAAVRQRAPVLRLVWHRTDSHAARRSPA